MANRLMNTTRVLATQMIQPGNFLAGGLACIACLTLVPSTATCLRSTCCNHGMMPWMMGFTTGNYDLKWQPVGGGNSSISYGHNLGAVLWGGSAVDALLASRTISEEQVRDGVSRREGVCVLLQPCTTEKKMVPTLRCGTNGAGQGWAGRGPKECAMYCMM